MILRVGRGVTRAQSRHFRVVFFLCQLQYDWVDDVAQAIRLHGAVSTLGFFRVVFFFKSHNVFYGLVQLALF